MSELVELLKARQGDKVADDFAHDLGIRGTTLYAYYRGDRSVGISVARRMAKYFQSQGDEEMVDALGAYVLGVEYSPRK